MKAKNPHGEMTVTHVLVLAASCLMAWGVMGMLNAYGVFFTPMGEALDAGKGAVALHLSLRTLTMGLASPLVAGLLAKGISHRKTMPLGMAIYLVTSVLITKARSMILVDILAVIGGFGLAFISFMLITIILGNWFRKDLGTFSGIAIAFSGIGSAIVSPVVTMLFKVMSYEAVYILYAVVTVLMVVPILFFPFSPDKMGLRPYGEGEVQERAAASVQYLDMPYRFLSPVTIVLFVMTLLIVGLTSLNSHLPSLAVSEGFTAETGALLLSASMIGNLVFKLLLGVVIDRLGVIRGFLMVLGISLAGLSALLVTRGSGMILLAGGFLYGTVFSLGSLGLSILTRTIYGNEQYNAVYAKVTLVTSVGSAAFVTLIGLLYDMTGSYRAPVILGIAMCAVNLALTLFLAAKLRGRSLKKLAAEG